MRKSSEVFAHDNIIRTMSYTPLDDKASSFLGTDGTTDLDDVVLTTSSSIKNNKSMNEAIDDEFRQSLSEPLTTTIPFRSNNNNNNRGTTTNHYVNDETTHQLPQLSADPFYVFRDDLYRQLSRVDETLAEYLRVVHHTVRGIIYIYIYIPVACYGKCMYKY